MDRQYLCKKCRSSLFTSDAVECHDPPGSRLQEDCTSVFVGVDEWIGDTSGAEGKIVCPKCQTKIGGWSWAGSKCSCGTWVCPAFQVLKSKIDLPRPVANIQACITRAPAVRPSEPAP
mmetsp:Transcript_22638/g.56800  ORF Transcript_22638/g.56800 Transcript_22638/m.56800 type:complete len:118 (-) Transcript_22638:265-618(-)